MRWRLGQTDDSGDSGSVDWQGIMNSTAQALPQLITGVTQAELAQNQISSAAQINQINIARAAQGLPPINVNLASAAPTVNVGISPEVQQIAEYAIFGVLGLALLRMLLK